MSTSTPVLPRVFAAARPGRDPFPFVSKIASTSGIGVEHEIPTVAMARTAAGPRIETPDAECFRFRARPPSWKHAPSQSD